MSMYLYNGHKFPAHPKTGEEGFDFSFIVLHDKYAELIIANKKGNFYPCEDGYYYAVKKLDTEPVAYLYNGERLPVLPEVNHPYMVIEYADLDDFVSGGRLARIICSSEPIQFSYTSLFQPRYSVLGNVQYFGFANHEGIWEWSFSMEEPYPPLNEWVDIGTEQYNERTDIYTKVNDAKPIWANHDVVYADDTAQGTPGDIYISASDPIPVYE